MNQPSINPLYNIIHESAPVLEIPQKKFGNITLFPLRLSALHNLLYIQYYSPVYGEDEFNCKSWELLDDDRYCVIHNTIGALASAVNTRYQEILDCNINSEELSVELLQFFTVLVDYFDSFRNGSPLRIVAKLINTQLHTICQNISTVEIIPYVIDGIRKGLDSYNTNYNIALQIHGLLVVNSGLTNITLLRNISDHCKFWFSIRDREVYKSISQEIHQLYQELRLPMVSTFTNNCEFIIDEVIYLALR